MIALYKLVSTMSMNVFNFEFNKALHSSILSTDIFFISARRFFDSRSLQQYHPLLSAHLAYAQAPKALLDPSLKMINIGCSLKRLEISDTTDVDSDESDQELEERILLCNMPVRTRYSRQVRFPARYHDFL